MFRVWKEVALTSAYKKSCAFPSECLEGILTSSGCSFAGELGKFCHKTLVCTGKGFRCRDLRIAWLMLAAHHASAERLWPGEGICAGFPCCNEEKI